MVAGQDTNSTPGEQRLKWYWGHGAGSLKIQWGTDGDWTRCVAELSRYIHSDHELKGFCSNLHHEVLGYWPGDTGKPGNPPEGAHRGPR
jgi:hypothetical protein